MPQKEVGDAFAQDTILRRFLGKMNAVENLAGGVENSLCRPIEKTLFDLLFVAGENHIHAADGLVQHLTFVQNKLAFCTKAAAEAGDAGGCLGKCAARRPTPGQADSPDFIPSLEGSSTCRRLIALELDYSSSASGKS